MIKHLLKIVWNRKRINGLILTEIVLSFLVLFAVLATAALYTINYRKPLGFSVDRVWSVSINPHVPVDSNRTAIVGGMALLDRALAEVPEVEAVGGIAMAPYSGSTWISGVEFEGRPVKAHGNNVTDGAGEVLKVDVVAGRWFSREDDGAVKQPAVINERLARELYGDANPLGKDIPFNDGRVVGVVRDFRKAGEFSPPVNYVLLRIPTTDTTSRHAPWDILVRVKPGTTAEFQEKMVKTLETVQKGWTFHVVRLESAREADFKDRLAPLIVGGVVAGFLLFMVALGLIGVLWQNVSQRTKEIGLRRAVGGSARQIHYQILAEMFVLTTFGLVIGSAIIVQFPMLNLITEIEIPALVYGLGFLVSSALMYVLTLLCGIYPSLLTLEVEPARALHYD